MQPWGGKSALKGARGADVALHMRLRPKWGLRFSLYGGLLAPSTIIDQHRHSVIVIVPSKNLAKILPRNHRGFHMFMRFTLQKQTVFTHGMTSHTELHRFLPKMKGGVAEVHAPFHFW